MTDKQIKYREVRTFGGILNAALYYMIFHFKSLIKIMLTYVAPIFVVAAIASYFFTSSVLTFDRLVTFIGNIKQHKPIAFISVVGLYFVGLTLQNQLLNKHLILSEEKNNGRISPEDLKPTIFEDLKLHLPNFFFLSLTLIAIFFIIGKYVLVYLIPDFTYGFMDDPLTFIVEALPFIIFFGALIPMICYFISTSLFVALRDKIGIFQSIAKVWEYIKPNLLKTWLLAFSAMIVAYLINVVVKFPLVLIGFLFGFFSKSFDQLDVTIFLFINLLTLFAGLIVSSTFQYTCIFHFTSLEELKEGNNIREKIENI